MSQNDFMKFFDPELTKSLSGFNGFPFDMNSLMETQRRNFQAFTEAQQRAIAGLQAVTQRQGELISEMVEDNSTIAQQILGEGSPEQKVAKQADLMKKVYEKNISNLKEIGDILNKSNQQAGEIINKRVSASLTEIKSAIEKTAKPAAAKKAA